MKKHALFLAVIATFAIASCGDNDNGGNTPTPTPTNNNTKATSQATMTATGNATLEAAASGLQNLTPVASISQSTTSKAAYSADINYTYDCTDGGTVLATGTLTGQCTQSGSNFACSTMVLDLALQFNDCTETTTLGGTDYAVTLNGSGTSYMTGSVSGDVNEGPEELNINGTGTADLTATGDATGAVSLDMSLTATGNADPEPTITCSGTASVVSGGETRVCGITSDCSGCEE